MASVSKSCLQRVAASCVTLFGCLNTQCQLNTILRDVKLTLRKMQ